MEELELWFRLANSSGLGPVSIGKLLQKFDNIQDIFSASGSVLQTAGLSKAQTHSLLESRDSAAWDKTQEWLQTKHHHLISRHSALYPARLLQIHDAPIVLYVIGDVDVLHTPQLAIVGSRKPTQSAAATAYQFAESIASKGITITSGLALGVDAEAHRGALQAEGLTIAVAATGLDRVYPARHRDLAHQIVAQGALISEFALGTETRASQFPRRNRIISGLSIGTLVVEAGLRSGTLTTARHAMDQGREVLAMPGSIHNPLARGCHQLIRQGAKLVETADDILEELAGQISLPAYPEQINIPKNKTTDDDLDSTYQQLLDCIDFSPQTIDRLIERSGLQAKDVSSMLLILELKGIIQISSGNRYARC